MLDETHSLSYDQVEMYAHTPNASATHNPVTSLQHPAPQVQHGHPQGMPSTAQDGGLHGISAQSASVQVNNSLHPTAASTSYVTGAYLSSGDAAIDRMVRLEAACKRFGSLI